MRILHVFDHTLPLHSGYTFRSAAILTAQRARGWQTFHLSSPRQRTLAPPSEHVEGFEFFRTPPVPAGLARIPLLAQAADMRLLAQRLDAVIRDIRPDILHAHSPVLNALPCLRVGARHAIPVLYEIRAFWEDAAVDHGTTHEGSLRYRLSRALETWAVQRADAVTCICEGLRSDLVGRGVDPRKITVIPNAVQTAQFPFCPARDVTLRDRLGLVAGEVLGFIGSFYGYEGLDLLVASLPAMLQQRPALKLLLVGGGPEEARLRAQVVALGLEKSVIFTGRVSHAEVNRYYSVIDVLVYPRHPMRLTELVTPLKPLEAMAQGQLFVASDVGGHRELVRDGENGRLFRAGDQDALVRTVLELLGDPEAWPRLRNAGRRYVEAERTWEASVARYAPVYERLKAQAERRSAHA
jgi:PEP-CTERM/exosortase A-associated glycosyltransferase